MDAGEKRTGRRRKRLTAVERRQAMQIAELQDRQDEMEQRDAMTWKNPIALLDRAAALLEDDTTRPEDIRKRAIRLVDEAIELLEADLQPA